MNKPSKAFVVLCFVAFLVLLIAVEVGRAYGWMVGALVPALLIICIRIITNGVGDRAEMGRKSKRMGNDEDE
jgi:hypothetical protein